MAFEKICSVDDVWEGGMDAFDTADGTSILVVGVEGGGLKAFQALCPHQEVDLVDGEYDGKIITCTAHLWKFDSATGEGLNPTFCKISEYPLRIEGKDVYVDVEGVEPVSAYS